ncbi:transposase [Dyadobacter diqingensis]|uniref:transposase n=1 Tax=Dyadobacter diqingensis TaxID=2938121 RepID=UPI0020C1A635|nr:transposase [Dyadobacter diqingensis]
MSQCFPKASKVIDRFHVQKPPYDAVQKIRIKHRGEALDLENQAIEAAKQVSIPLQTGNTC